MASTTMTSDKGYRTTMSVAASLSGNTQGNTREVKASATINFLDSAYGSYAYAPVTYVLQINGTTVDSWAPTRVERTSYSMSGSLYVTAGQTITVKMYAYISWSGADFSYPPNPDNGGSSVSVSVKLEALQSMINSVKDFTVEDDFSVGITKYDSSFTDKLEIKIGTTIIKTISAYTNNSAIRFTDSEILKIYNTLSHNSATFTFALTTLNGSSTVGTNSANATGTAKGTAKININDSWKRGIVWIKVNGVWKRALIFVNSGGWKRGG